MDSVSAVECAIACAQISRFGGMADGDELEESAGRTTAGIARVLTEEQARTIAAATGG